jgi:SAM-dependent methyltransferase
VALSDQEGEIAGISYRLRGAGPPLVLLPLDLSPGQWEPLIPALSARYCTITLGGALLGSVASLEERGRSGYMGVVRGLLDALAIVPGESVLEVGCGSGVIMRELARRTAGANRLIGRDMSPYLLREARALARREGLLDRIDFGEGRAEALPLADGVVDVALSSTVFEEGDADLMLSEIARVTRPGGRVGVVVRAIDMPFWVNLPLDPALKAKVDAPGVIGGGMAPRGVADASLYRRFHALGLTGLKCFPQLVSVVPGQPRLERYQQQILAALDPAETETWRQAVAAADRDGTFFIAQAYHCAIGTKPG